MHRPRFIESTTFAGFSRGILKERKFKPCLNPGAIGVKLDQKGLLEAAVKYGYEGIVPFSGPLQNWSDDESHSFTANFPDASGDFGFAFGVMAISFVNLRMKKFHCARLLKLKLFFRSTIL